MKCWLRLARLPYRVTCSSATCTPARSYAVPVIRFYSDQFVNPEDSTVKERVYGVIKTWDIPTGGGPPY